MNTLFLALLTPACLLAQFGPSHLFLAGLFATSAMILFQTQRRWQRAPQFKPMSKYNPANERSAKPATSPATSSMKQWELQVHDLARDTIARIDSKMAALEHLIRAAHHESLRLEAALSQARAAGIAAELPSAAGAVDFTPLNQAHQLQEAARGNPAETRSEIPKPHLKRPNAEIFALADAGVSLHQIAARTGTPEGEVELILALRDHS